MPPTRTTRFDSLEQEAFLNLWRTYDRLRAMEDELFAGFELTPQQYNVLRLLASAREPVPTSALVNRMVSRAPDVTRMLDKLEARSLILRKRSHSDRRSVSVSIAPAGRDLVVQIADPLRQCHAKQLGHLPPDDLASLVTLLKKARSPHEPETSPWKENA